MNFCGGLNICRDRGLSLPGEPSFEEPGRWRLNSAGYYAWENKLVTAVVPVHKANQQGVGRRDGARGIGDRMDCHSVAASDYIPVPDFEIDFEKVKNFSVGIVVDFVVDIVVVVVDIVVVDNEDLVVCDMNLEILALDFGFDYIAHWKTENLVEYNCFEAGWKYWTTVLDATVTASAVPYRP